MAVDFSDKFGSRNLLFMWRRRFYDQLITFAKTCVDKQGGAAWISSVGNHKDAFLSLYANLLGFYALSNCIFAGESVENDKSILPYVVGLGEFIKPFLRTFDSEPVFVSS
ncbi:hypothetical protein RHMOL_Rhmol10G0048600 [Rhododendron molle]|uniref:Uncharacterized protein n=1 Tax=Rhododendron molle TaxID=49168 RepID=A0ACC0LZ57_RHOML|nr:hypothetical protein RHMOL_Rhmol10G0048600 [Rhododendron molle]